MHTVNKCIILFIFVQICLILSSIGCCFHCSAYILEVAFKMDNSNGSSSSFWNRYNAGTLNSPTSDHMKRSFLIKNHDASNFDSYYQQMRKRKTMGGSMRYNEGSPIMRRERPGDA